MLSFFSRILTLWDLTVHRHVKAWTLTTVLIGLSNAWYLTHLAFSRYLVCNVTDVAILQAHTRSGASIPLTSENGSYLLRSGITSLSLRGSRSLDDAVRIRRWAHRQQRRALRASRVDIPDLDDPAALLQMQSGGGMGGCRQFAYVLMGALQAAGFDARIVNVAEDVYDQSPNHTLVEVWIEQRRKWVLIDSMYDILYEVDGVPASVSELAIALRPGSHAKVVADSGDSILRQLRPVPAYSREIYQHVYVASVVGLNDGLVVPFLGRAGKAFLHYSPEGMRYPATEKLISLLICACSGASLAVCGFTLCRRRHQKAGRLLHWNQDRSSRVGQSAWARGNCDRLPWCGT